MSTAQFSEDGKEVYIECNYGRKVGVIVLKHLDKNSDVETDNDCILIKFTIRDVTDINSQMVVTNQLILRKEYTAVLSHVFREVSNVMDNWYETPDLLINGKKRRWIPGHYEDVE